MSRRGQAPKRVIVPDTRYQDVNVARFINKVMMQGKKSVKLGLFDAVWMEGTLKITNYDSPYGQVGFTIEGLSMKPYTGK